MKRKIILSVILMVMAVVCVAIAGCRGDIQKLMDEGYDVFVTYDANGGNYGEVGTTVRMDAFIAEEWPEDEEGNFHIKLEDFEERNSLTGVADVKSPVRDSYGFWGWYRTRELYLVDGTPIDLDGNALYESEDGVYYIEGTETQSYPVYTYYDMWDFDKDEILYSGDGILEITLYAAWIPYFEFDFYYIDAKDGEVLYGTSSFNYASYLKNSNETNTLIVPSYDDEGGAMVYRHEYSSGGSFTFPSRSGYTFDAAYYYLNGDKVPISDSLEHWGYVDEDLLTHDYKMKIYVDFVDGERYLIMTASQFLSYASAGVYYLLGADLDFYNEENKSYTNWPATISSDTFTGAIVSYDGNPRTISNVYVRYGSDTSYGGLFGCIGKSAVIENITFDTVTFDLYSMSKDISRGFYGLFAGDIEKGATLTNVTLRGELEFTVGAVSCDSTGKSINFFSYADLGDFGVVIENGTLITLSCYSSSRSGNTSSDGSTTYYYTVVCQGPSDDKISMDENYDITYGLHPSRAYRYAVGTDEDGKAKYEYYTEDYYVIYSSVWGNAES